VAWTNNVESRRDPLIDLDPDSIDLLLAELPPDTSKTLDEQHLNLIPVEVLVTGRRISDIRLSS